MQQNTRKTLEFFFKHIKHHRLVAITMTIALIVGVAGSMGWALLFRKFFDILVSPGTKEAIASGLISMIVLIMLLEGIEWISWRVAHYLNNYFQPKIMSEITNECFEYMHKHSYRFFTDNFAGSLVKKINRLVRGFERVADKIYWDLGSMALRLFIILAVLIYIHPLLGFIMGTWSAIFLFINYRLSVYKLKFDIPRSKQDSKVTAVLADK